MGRRCSSFFLPFIFVQHHRTKEAQIIAVRGHFSSRKCTEHDKVNNNTCSLHRLLSSVSWHMQVHCRIFNTFSSKYVVINHLVGFCVMKQTTCFFILRWGCKCVIKKCEDFFFWVHNVDESCWNFYVVRTTSAKFYLRAGGTKLGKQNAEFCLFRINYAQLNTLITGKGRVRPKTDHKCPEGSRGIALLFL